MNRLSLLTKQNIAIGLIWLFHVSGIMGIIYSDATWFVKATPINLLLSFVLLLINSILKQTSFKISRKQLVVGYSLRIAFMLSKYFDIVS